MPDFITEVKDFSEINTSPVVVEFYSSRCSACKNFEDTYEEAAKNHPDINFYRINIFEKDRDGQMPGMEQGTKCGIRSLPTLLGFTDQINCDEDHERMYGKQSKEELEKWIEQIELSSKIEEQQKEEINKNSIKRHKHRRG